MIDGERQDLAGVPLGPVAGQPQEGDGIPSAGQAEGDGRWRMGQQPPIEAGLGLLDRRGDGRQLQRARVRATWALALTAAVALEA